LSLSFSQLSLIALPELELLQRVNTRITQASTRATICLQLLDQRARGKSRAAVTPLYWFIGDAVTYADVVQSGSGLRVHQRCGIVLAVLVDESAGAGTLIVLDVTRTGLVANTTEWRHDAVPQRLAAACAALGKPDPSVEAPALAAQPPQQLTSAPAAAATGASAATVAAAATIAAAPAEHVEELASHVIPVPYKRILSPALYAPFHQSTVRNALLALSPPQYQQLLQRTQHVTVSCNFEAWAPIAR
jgi:hypothetical protein